MKAELLEDGRAGLVCLPAIAALLAAGIASGHTGGALVAASGAISVGFGCFQRFTRSKAAPMLFAALGMGTSAVCGSLLGETWPVFVIAAAVWAAVCAWALAFGMGPWWIALQWSIALFVAGAYPSGLHGALQFGLVVLAWRLQSHERAERSVRMLTYLRFGRLQLAASVAFLGYALCAGAAVAICVTLSRTLEWSRPFCAPELT